MRLLKAIKKSLRNLFTEDDPTKIWVQIPRTFKTNKDKKTWQHITEKKEL